jgi:hypothetical protein
MPARNCRPASSQKRAPEERVSNQSAGKRPLSLTQVPNPGPPE